MSSRPPFRKGDYESYQFVRWVLFLVNAAEAAGIEHLSRHRLHALLFMSFASSRYYNIHPLRQRAQRTMQGPYYRAAHLALGSLTLSGLLEVKDFVAYPSPKDIQFEGSFVSTVAGLDASHVLRETQTGAELYRFLLDLCLSAVLAMGEQQQNEVAGSSKEGKALDRMLAQDLTYQQAVLRPGGSLLVEETVGDLTPTFVGLDAIKHIIKQPDLINSRDVLIAYQRLLKARAA